MAVFLISDPWPDNSLKPIDFTITSPDYPSPVLEPVASNPDGTVYLKHDVSSFASIEGQHVLTVVARGFWGDGAPVDFPFESGLPSPPSNLRLVKM
jgi:hypothetical protein